MSGAFSKSEKTILHLLSAKLDSVKRICDDELTNVSEGRGTPRSPDMVVALRGISDSIQALSFAIIEAKDQDSPSAVQSIAEVCNDWVDTIFVYQIAGPVDNGGNECSSSGAQSSNDAS